MKQRNLYLKNTPVDEAKRIYDEKLSSFLTPEYETIPVTESLHRTTRHAVYARYCSPMYNAAAMDGIAVVSSHTVGADEQNPGRLRPGEDFAVVDTGDPIHPPYDAVIMAEDLSEDEDGTVVITAPAAHWQHIRDIGEDIVAGEMLLPGRHKIRPVDIGVLLAGGILEIEVVKKPHVAIFPTGTEIIEPTQQPKDGDIIETNSRVFEGLVTENGGIAHRFAPIPDDYELLKKAIGDAAGVYDMVIVNAGSSAGTEDYTVHILRELGEVYVHGVSVKPGKPVILARIGSTPVIGLPGYPVAAYVNFENFVIPVLKKLTGETEDSRTKAEAFLSRRVLSSLKYKEYIRVKAGQVGDKLVVSPLSRGGGAAMSLVRADGFCVIDQDREGYEAGEKIEVELYRTMEEIRNTVVATGSHDMILDVLSDMLSECHPGTYLSSAHVGSMGGLMALKRGEAHLAPTHLLDEETGIYNVSALEKIFREPIALVKGADRIQGILVKKGNPLQIKSIRDLTRCRYVNRQRGAGTRVLFDYLLKKEGILPEQIVGYDREAATHMALAAMVGSDGADAGMGIESAARAMDLDFIPIGPEEYDFAIPVKYLELPIVKNFLDILCSEAFRKRVEEMGGYRFRQTGKIVRSVAMKY